MNKFIASKFQIIKKMENTIIIPSYVVKNGIWAGINGEQLREFETMSELVSFVNDNSSIKTLWLSNTNEETQNIVLRNMPNLSYLDVSNINTNKMQNVIRVINMSKLTKLILPQTYPSLKGLSGGIYHDLPSLTTEFDFTGWNTDNLEEGSFTYELCSNIGNITRLNISGWNISLLSSTSYTLIKNCGCQELIANDIRIDGSGYFFLLSNFVETNKKIPIKMKNLEMNRATVGNMKGIYLNINPTYVENISIANWTIEPTGTIKQLGIFESPDYGVSSSSNIDDLVFVNVLQNCDLTNLITQKVEGVVGLHSEAKTSYKIDGWDTSSTIVDIPFVMIQSEEWIKSLIDGGKVGKVRTSQRPLIAHSAIETLDLRNQRFFIENDFASKESFDLKVLFCKNLTQILCSENTFNAPIERIEYAGCQSLENIPMGNPDMSSLKYISQSFYWTKITNFTGLNVTSTLRQLQHPFNNQEITHIDLKNHFTGGISSINITELENLESFSFGETDLTQTDNIDLSVPKATGILNYSSLVLKSGVTFAFIDIGSVTNVILPSISMKNTYVSKALELIEYDMSMVDTSNFTSWDWRDMYTDCPKLTTVYVKTEADKTRCEENITNKNITYVVKA